MGRTARVLWGTLLIVWLCVFPRAVAEDYSFVDDIAGFEAVVDYGTYLESYLAQGAARPNRQVIVLGDRYARTNMHVELVFSEEYRDHAVLTEERGFIEWDVYVQSPGLYNIEVAYFPAEGRGTAIERALEINGEPPFDGASYLVFPRIWGDAESIRTDNQGNELRPAQKEYPMWQTAVLSDAMGLYTDPYLFYFHAGKNTIRLISRREPMLIHHLRLFQVEAPPSYAELAAEYSRQGFKPAEGVFLKLQERDSSYRSDANLAPSSDHGDPTLEPYHPVLMRLNAIGGNWSQHGQWIRWDFTVPQSGLYKIGIKAKQHLLRGSFSNRRIYIDGKVPFQELSAVRFPYSSVYDMYVLGGEEPYLIYLEEGPHSITLEVVLGDMVDIIRTVERSVYDLNTIYRQIVMITSPSPDPMRTYELPKRIPGLLDNMRIQAGILDSVADDLEAYTGQKGGATVVLRDLARQLYTLIDDPDSIPKRLAKFRDNLGGLGTWLLEVRVQPLYIDYLVIASPEQEMPRASATFSERLGHEVRALASSYTHDYAMVGDVYAGDAEPLTVWVGWGRDQAQVLKRLIENDFTPRTGIPVNLELVSMGVLLPATVAGRGPDVAMGVNTTQPINFAFRGGVVDLAALPGFEEVRQRFMHSALVPFIFRDSVYALPDQQPFLMMFYRIDVLHELGLEIPQTWDDVLEIIPILQKRNMQFGLPFSVPIRAMSTNIGDVSATVGSLSSSGGVLNLLMFMYQRGQELFVADGVATNLDHEAAVDAFALWTELYELYKLPVDYNAANRFRMGDMPIVIAGYGLYNELQVFAPELRGKWGFSLVPGTRREDGTIDRSAPTSVGQSGSQTGSMILADSDQIAEAWEFLKWWTSTETQIEFGRQIESVLGVAGRYATANVEALAGLPWSVDEYERLMAQWRWIRGVPEVPGGYVIGRYLDNAFRQVVYNNKPARDVLVDYNRLINEEIERKRIEFGLPTTVEELPPEHRRLYWVEQ
ncbi:MAG: extracellular solute-binding protein [Limnochordia bacterium]|jgi:ABC-type glycerol-3-phosphate transport system substrate-binding protein